MTYRRRRMFALLALLGLLFQQLAMAAYVCPIDAAGVQAAAADLPPCHPARSGSADRVRCHAHCHPQSVSSDHAPVPTVPAAILPATTWLRAAAWQPQILGRDRPFEVSPRAAAPPLNLEYCRFLI